MKINVSGLWKWMSRVSQWMLLAQQSCLTSKMDAVCFGIQYHKKLLASCVINECRTAIFLFFTTLWFIKKMTLGNIVLDPYRTWSITNNQWPFSTQYLQTAAATWPFQMDVIESDMQREEGVLVWAKGWKKMPMLAILIETSPGL